MVNGRKILSARGRENKEALNKEAWLQYRGDPLKGPISVTIRLFWPTRRNHDVDNIKTALDALSGLLWDDDGQIQELHLYKAYDKEKPRMELSVTELSTPV